MIERRIKNDQTRARYRKFKKNKLSVVSIFVLGFFCFASITAELWINNRPLVLWYQGDLYFPAIRNYAPSDFKVGAEILTDYRTLSLHGNDFAIWPIIRWDPYESNPHVDQYPAPPSFENWLGTDDRGRDVLARLVYGFRYTMGYALGVWFLSYLLGTACGAVFGFFGGKADLLGSRFVELVEMLPATLILITIISIFAPNLFWLIFLSFIFDWTRIFHQMRAQFLMLRHREFVDSARALGVSNIKIMTSHILPNALTPIITFSPFTIAANIYALAVLDYLGLGLPAPTPSWGELIAEAQKYITTAEWLVWSSTVAIVVTMVALIQIGLSVRDVYDSRKV